MTLGNAAMSLLKNIFLALVFGLIAAPTLAQDAPAPPGQQAADLARACQGQGRHHALAVEKQWDTALFGEIDFVECTAYLAGIADMNAVTKRVFGRGVFCFPRAGVTAEQQAQAVLRWAKAHPHLLHESRRSGAVSAFVEAWPCG
jgi:hypothetical protein